ncbi:MAG TPA: Flp pilus assembly protein CpaB [Gaiellaceae bacterium]|nr:Flp pilus assembly protein CpaB [Gaiellaceae bacterium]
MTYRLRNIGLAIALAAVAVLLVFYYVAQERGRLQEDQELVPVWVATKNIPSGTLGADLESGGYIEKAEVERSIVAPGALLDPQAVATKIVVDPLYKGEQVSQLRFRSQAERGVRAQLTGNLRAFQVPGTEHQLLSGTLQEGDRVDVVATIDYKFVNFGPVPQGTSNEELTASRVVLRDLLVLRAPKVETTTSKISDGANQGGNISVLLAVTDAQAQKLAFVTRDDGPAWTLQLRPPLDASDSPESVETVATILTDGLKAQQLQLLVPEGGSR